MTDRSYRGVRSRLLDIVRRSGADLTVILAVTALTDLFVLVPVLSESAGRLFFGLAFLLFVPGYAIITAVFPQQADGESQITRTERIALASVTSVVVVPLVCIALTVVGVGIRLLPLVVVLNVVTVGAATVAANRRLRHTDETHSMPQGWNITAREWTLLDIALAVVVGLAVVTVGFVAVAPDSGGSTELYLLTDSDYCGYFRGWVTDIAVSRRVKHT